MKRDAATGLEVVSARFHGHAYDMHLHDEWLVGVTRHGVQDFFCRGQRRQSTPGRVILIEPGERHDGQAVRDDGFSYCMLYLPQAWIREQVGGDDSRFGVRRTLTDDPLLADSLLSTCAAVFEAAPRLTVEAGRDAVTRRLRAHFGVAPPETASGPRRRGNGPAERAMDYLRAHFADDIGMAEVVAAAGAADRFQLARGFRARFGTSPHACQVQLRLAEARRLLRAQMPPAEAACLSGFADQSHMGRWFRRAYGVTPATYRRGRTNVPDSGRRRG